MHKESMSVSSSQTPFPFWRTLWLSVALFLAYLAVSMAMPVITIFAHKQLGFGNAMGGLAVGIAFLTTVLTRGVAGRYADTRGGKIIMVCGLMVYATASLICLASSYGALGHGAAYGVLLLGRLLLGLGESLTLVGMMTWGIGLSGKANVSTFIAMMGAGMYGSFALGSPLALALYANGGFEMVMTGCIIAPIVGLLMVIGIPKVGPVAAPKKRQSFLSILHQIRWHGFIVGLQGVGFATIGAFEALMFKERGWSSPGAGLAAFAIGFVCMRVIGPYLLKRLGARGLVFVSFVLEGAGQAMLWLAPNPTVAIIGSFLSGFGCSMIYPAMGADVVRIMPAHLGGTAIGGFSLFQDIAYGITGPVAGAAADVWGQPVAFLLGALAVACGIGLLITRRDLGRSGQ